MQLSITLLLETIFLSIVSGIFIKNSKIQKANIKVSISIKITPLRPQNELINEASIGVITVNMEEEREFRPLAEASFFWNHDSD